MSHPGPEPAAAEQGFFSHLVELRTRLLYALAGVLAVFLVLLPFSRQLYTRFAMPMLSRLPEGAQMVAIEVASPLLVPLKLSLFAAIVIAMPWVLYQVWAFVAPALYRHERRLAVPVLISSVVLFYLGCAFAHFLVLPLVIGFFTTVIPEGVTVMTDIGHYLSFVTRLFLAFGIGFELPVVLVILVKLGWVSVPQLREARPYVVVGTFVVAMIVTPPDVISQILLAVPLCLLYEVGILVSAGLGGRESVAAEKTSEP